MNKNLKILSLHLGGAHTKKSALVRGDLVFPKDNVGELKRPSFLLNLSLGNIGVTKYKDADSRLLELVADLMPFDVLCIDSATWLPPCINCVLRCPGVPLCEVQSVNFMKVAAHEELELKTKEVGRGRHTRFAKMPQPYLERSVELKLRSISQFSQVKGILDLEPVLGSNRAPLSLRSMRFLNQFKSTFPSVQILETPSLLATQGISQEILKSVPSLSEIKREISQTEFKHSKKMQTTFRQTLLKALLQEQILTFDANTPLELRHSLVENFHEFLALMGGLVAWSQSQKITSSVESVVGSYVYYSNLFSEKNISWPTQH